MKRIAIVNGEDGRITNIIVVANDAEASEFGGRELTETQNIGDVYIRPKTLEEQIRDLREELSEESAVIEALLGGGTNE